LHQESVWILQCLLDNSYIRNACHHHWWREYHPEETTNAEEVRHTMRDGAPLPAEPQEAPLASAPQPGLTRSLWHDPVLLGASLVVLLLSGTQLTIILLSPPWSGPFNQWLLTILGWLGFLGVLLVAGWASRQRRPAALTWWLWSAALFCYASGWAVQMAGIHLLLVDPLPFPWWSDLLWLLQYPFFFLALLFIPTTPTPLPPGLARLKLSLDCLLLMGAATLLTWYFLLTPIYMESQQSLVGKLANLAYPVGDLGVLFLLSVLFLRAKSFHAERLVLGLATAALLLLIISDSWYAILNLHGQYQPGGITSAFWGLTYLLFPLTGLVAVRLAQRRPTALRARQTAWMYPSIHPQELLDALRFLLPFIAALLAGIITLLQVFLAPESGRILLLPITASLGLLALTVVRQGVVFLELMRLRREREAARANERATRETARQMDNFLNIASHELRTPLTTTTLQLQIAQRGLQHWKRQAAFQPSETATMLQKLETNLAQTEEKLKRLNRLAADLLDTSRIQAEQLALHMEPINLLPLVEQAVEEQRQMAPERTIHLYPPDDCRVPVLADPDRICQVITNYLTNALKYSPEDRPVEVGVQRTHIQAQVWVRDQGPGVLPEEQERIWERFHRAKGVEAKSGSGIGLGLGLFLSKVIVEQHQGQVGVRSTPGQGSTFWFTLPLTRLEGDTRRALGDSAPQPSNQQSADK
jgi:signal transduction histidine kinase